MQVEISKLAEPQVLDLTRDGKQIPAVIWIPKGVCHGIVLACHGGSGHKLSGAILMIAQAFVPMGFAVLAIDGPVHGERRTDGNLDPVIARQSFRTAWREGVGQISMAADMSAALDLALNLPGLANLPVGYIGVSMGTAYGIPLLASDPRISAAAIGLWSTNYASSSHLLEHARTINCDVWFTMQWHDEFFDHPGTFALFDAIGASDKRLVAYPGPHVELQGERLSDAVAFLAGRFMRSS